MCSTIPFSGSVLTGDSLFSEDEPYQNGFQEETPVFEKKQVDLTYYLSDSWYVKYISKSLYVCNKS